MHVAVRRSELNRIATENAIIAKKIYYAAPKLSTTKEMQENFREHRYLSNNLAKIKRRTLGPSHTANQSVSSVSKISNKGRKNTEFTLPPINYLATNYQITPLNTER